jgi:hypothetical protein
LTQAGLTEGVFAVGVMHDLKYSAGDAIEVLCSKMWVIGEEGAKGGPSGACARCELPTDGAVVLV